MDRIAALLVSAMAFLAPAASSQEGERAPHLSPQERAAIDSSLARGARWLRARADETGVFRAAQRADTSPLALSAMALWALLRAAPEVDADADADPGRRDALRATVDLLLASRQNDGGIYEPERALAVYTSGVAARALTAFHERWRDQDLARPRADVEAFVYRAGVPESLVDGASATGRRTPAVAAVARGLLHGGLSTERKAALEFLARCSDRTERPPLRTRHPEWTPASAAIGPVTYEDVLPFVYREVRPVDQIALRTRQALRELYTLERNPDLTKRFGSAGFQPGTQGLYYYYLLVARSLAVYETPYHVTTDGVVHDWVRELSERLLGLQHESGEWANDDGTWWEDEPVLVTSYALLALGICRDVESFPKPR